MQIFLHVGLPRAASRFLRRHVWQEHSQVELLFSKLEEERYLRSISSDDSLEFDEEEVRRGLNLPTDEHTRVGVVSYPTLSAEGGADRALKVDRCYRLFPDAKIIFMIRNQFERLRSLYAMSQQRGIEQGVKNFPSLEKWAKNAPNIAPTNSVIQWRRPLDRICERPILDQYLKTFGCNRVCVLPMELIYNDPKFFADRLADFMGINSEELLSNLNRPAEGQRIESGRLKLRTTRVSAGLGRVLKRFGVLPKDKIVKADISIPSYVRNYMVAECGESNKELASRFNLPLQDLGYPWPS